MTTILDIDEETRLTNLPLEVLRLILEKLYEEPHTLSVTKSLRSDPTFTSDLPTNILLLNHLIRIEALNALPRSSNNTITLYQYSALSDITPHLTSPSALSFFSSVTTLNLTEFPYYTSILKSWKQICPRLINIRVAHAYTPTASPVVHRSLLIKDFPSLLRGDADEHFAATAVQRITTIHPAFRLSDLEGLSLTVPNIIDFWSPTWGREWYHENRVLTFDLTISSHSTSAISQKWFKNRIRNLPYQHTPLDKDLPRFSGVDYEVRFFAEGNAQSPDYDWRTDCFRSPYSAGWIGG